jgi:two-component system chemotaxis response regulator CheB
MVRVLVVDDSAFARKVVREILTGAGFEVVGVARDGLEALEKIAELKPDVVTLDLVMPNLDGLGVLAALSTPGAPRVVVVSMAGDETALGMAALHAGAVEIVRKPTALATERLREISDEVVRAVGAAALARQPGLVGPVVPHPAFVKRVSSRSVVVIGTSTGGPQALTRLVASLPQDFPVPVAIVLHLPPGYTEAFARRLNDEGALEVVEASANLEMTAGRVIVARAGLHLKLRRDGTTVRTVFDAAPADVPHRPSVDVLFRSAAEVYGAGVLGVVLTGMGDDGLQGARAIRAAGGELVTEAEASCVVYGMPRCVDEAGLSSASAPISEMAQTILQRL